MNKEKAEKVVFANKGAVMLDFGKDEAVSILCQAMFDEVLRLRQPSEPQCERQVIRKFLLDAFHAVSEIESPSEKMRTALDDVMKEAEKVQKATGRNPFEFTAKIDGRPVFDMSKAVRRANENKIKTELASVKTCDLVAELRNREGVKARNVGPYRELTITTEGPAVVLVVTD